MTKVLENDFDDAVCDEYGLYYSRGYKRLLSYKNPKKEERISLWSKIVIHPQTEIICDNAFLDYGWYDMYSEKIMTELILPEGLKVIGEHSFMHSRFSYVLIPKSVTTILGNPFAFSTISKIDVFSDSYILNEGILYEKNKGSLLHCFSQIEYFFSHPDTLCIEEAAFAHQLKLKSVILSRVVDIGSKSFYKCPDLEFVKLSNNLISIGEKAFKQEIEKSSINTEEEINNYYETRRSHLLIHPLEMILPESIRHIGEEALAHIRNIKSNSPNFIIKDGLLLSKDGKTLLNCLFSPQTLTVPESVEKIWGAAFEGCQTLERLVIPDNVKSIGNCAFRFCYELKSVYFESIDTQLGEYVFADCINLKHIILPLEIKEIPRYSFSNCIHIDNIVFPNSVVRIGKSAFYGCAFEELKMPNELLIIDKYALGHCSNLRTLILNDKIEEIGFCAFRDSDKIQELYLPPSLKHIESLAFNLHNKVTIASSLTYIEKEGLGGHIFDLIVQIPTRYVWDMNSRFEIQHYEHIFPLFRPLSLEERLSGLDMGSFHFNQYDYYSGGRTIDYGKLGEYSSDMECLISYKVSFDDINKIILDKRVKYICNRAFVKDDCGFVLSNQLKPIVLHDTIIAIGDNAYEGCCLNQIRLPKQLVYIGDFAFKDFDVDDCKIIIPEKVNHLGVNPFARDFCFWKKRLEIECHSPFFKIVNDTLYTSDMKRLIYSFNRSDCIIVPEGVESIDAYAFSHLPLKSVVFPFTVKQIGEHAFAWCDKLEKINLFNLREIGESCFCGCKSLKKIVLPNIDIINAYMFAYCDNLHTITINERTKSIGNCTFKNCHKLEKLMLTENIEHIGESAFVGSGIKQIICKTSYFEVKNKLLFTKGFRTLLYSFNDMPNITLPPRVVVISNEAFAGKKDLKRIEFPRSLLKLGERLFSGCSNLEMIDLSKTKVQKINKETLYGCESKPTIKYQDK